jgi:hypothetical protein
MVQDIQRLGLDKPERTQFLVMGYMAMDLLSEEEFRAELDKAREEKPVKK